MPCLSRHYRLLRPRQEPRDKLPAPHSVGANLTANSDDIFCIRSGVVPLVRVTGAGAEFSWRTREASIAAGRPLSATASLDLLLGTPATAIRAPVAKSWCVGVRTARAQFHVASERIGSFEAFRIPEDLKTGHQLHITRRSAGSRHPGANGLVGGWVFGPVLLERVLCIALVGKTCFFVAPENDCPAPGRFATRPDLKYGRAAPARPRSLPLRWRARRLRRRAPRSRARKPLVLADVGREIARGWLVMSDQSLLHGEGGHSWSQSAARSDREYRKIDS
jgi:hypothetical protein